jgi:phage portal protein, HK97 family
MGFFDRFRKKQEIRSMVSTIYKNDWQYFTWNYANQIYNIPEVRNAIERIADIFSSCDIWSERINKDGTVDYLTDAEYRILSQRPNPLQNRTQFIKDIVTRLLLDNNVFIEPVWTVNNGKASLKAIYPLPYKNVEFDLEGNNAYVRFLDSPSNDKKNLNDIIYLSRFCSINGGYKNNLGLYETVIKSLSEHIVNFASPNKPQAILQSNLTGQGALKDKDRNGVMNDVKASFAKNVQGIAYLDKMWTITPINWNDSDVNKDLMQFVIGIVYNYFNISEGIINNTASEIEMAMFVKTTIKPLAKQFSEEFTNKLFTENEYYFGRRIEFDWSPLLVTTLASEASASQILIRNGVLSIDEARERIGYPPLKDGLGNVHRASADLVNINIIDDYELGKVNKEVEDDSKQDNRIPNGKIECRAENQESGKKLVLRGYPILFNTETTVNDWWYGEVREKIEPTALDGTDLSQVYLVTGHNYNPEKVLGRAGVNMRLEVR